MMIKFETLAEALEARREGAQTIHYIDSDHSERLVPLRALYDRALGLLHHFQAKGARPGSEMIILVDSNEQFIDAFWACVLGNIIAVPLAPGISDDHRLKFMRVLRNLKQPHLSSDGKTFARLAAFAAANGLTTELERLRSASIFLDQLDDISQHGKVCRPTPDDVAFVQYSSGSTSTPKGVALSHRNLVTNITAIIHGADIGPRDSTLSWMPLTHDMGLIGFHLTPLFAGISQYLMPTALFVRRPLLWLTKASETRATLLCSPNFGYRHFLKLYQPEKSAPLDLSRVRVLFNGAEPISVDLCAEFLARMAPAGLKETTMFPVYGLAEASLAVAFPLPGTAYTAITINRDTLGVGAAVETVVTDHPRATRLACVGNAVEGCSVLIADADGDAVPIATVGRVLIRGDNVTRGYYQDPEATRELISADGWLDTGDLGFMASTGLVITGRLKEILFVNGQNYYPQDLETALDRYAGIELGKAAACAVRPARADADEVLIFVQHRGEIEEFVPVTKLVRKCINEQIGIVVDHVLPVARIPKTTSGKTQRYLLARAYEVGEFANTIAALRASPADANDSATTEHGEVETTLREICNAFLGDKPISVNDNIFEHGTSSLMLAQIYQRIESVYPGQIEVTDFFDYPTIAELARYLERRLVSAHA